jgi:hypothetical protein
MVTPAADESFIKLALLCSCFHSFLIWYMSTNVAANVVGVRGRRRRGGTSIGSSLDCQMQCSCCRLQGQTNKQQRSFPLGMQAPLPTAGVYLHLLASVAAPCLERTILYQKVQGQVRCPIWALY